MLLLTFTAIFGLCVWEIPRHYSFRWILLAAPVGYFAGFSGYENISKDE